MKQRKNTFPRKQSGFSLIELLVCLVIFGILMTAVFSSFIQTTQRSVQQSNIAETKIEMGVGFDLLRSDLEHAGFGLPWLFPAGSNPNPYSEPAPMSGVPDIPRAFSSENASGSSMNGSDYLVIRATNVIRGVTGQKWGYVGRDAGHNIIVQPMSDDAFLNSDYVIVLHPERSPGEFRQLVMNGNTYATRPTKVAMDNFAPMGTPNDPDGEKFLVYGLNDHDPSVANHISRPFNRTDYYINNNNVPTHCAPNTGVLVKATVNQANDNFNVMPIVDCVADFQIVYYLDTNGDGGSDQRTNANGLNGFSAAQIRDQVKAVRCYILTHQGGLDRSYTYGNTSVNVGEVDAAGINLLAGRSFTLETTIGGNWAHYRWKVESIAVTPKNLQ